MLELSGTTRWEGRGRRAVSAAVVVICYLIVFAGLLYSIAGS